MKYRFGWPLWAGLALSIFAFLSYFVFFSRFPITRDIPWVPYLLFAVAIVLLVMGVRGAKRKVLAMIPLLLGLFVVGAFTYSIVGSANLPPSARAPKVGEQAPRFTLSDPNGRMVSLDEALAGSKGVLLVFYRGYW